jgi:predicted peptidase
MSQTAQHLERRISRTVNLDYLLALPEGYDAKRKARHPLVLFLHGSGERGNDLSKVAVHGPPKLVAQGQRFPFILASPQCPDDAVWNVDDLTALLDDLEERLRVDARRIYVTGLSMGGYGTWDLAMHTPERFAAIAPICGGGFTFFAHKIKHLPVWAFHGAKDKIVPLEATREMVRALRANGNRHVKLSVYPNAGHNAWDKAYGDARLWAWMLEQRRG